MFKDAHTDIIVVSWNNKDLLTNCLYSILNYSGSPYTVHIVNNGEPNSLDHLVRTNVRVYDTGSNLGWMGGINYVKDKVEGPFVMLLNDDTQFIHWDRGWLKRLLVSFFRYENVGAVGPVSNNVSGTQYINYQTNMPKTHTAPVLIGFCLLTTKENLDKVGWLDASLRGGDDLDLCIKLQDLGKTLIVRRDVTVLHHYAATGKRVHGDYWDSVEHTENIHMDLVRKHGLKRFINFQQGMSMVQPIIKEPNANLIKSN